ncbi:MAG: hypothetical protein QF524_05705, partial [Planctomycetota bacterium]|nr:hypothetical protein [Planctomycetota bacterium]
DDFLPNRLSLRTMDLRLSDWAPGSKGRLFPKRWEWKTPALTQVEIFPVIEDGVLVFDKAFGPFSEADSSQDAIGNWVGNSSKDSKQRIKGEEYGLQIRPPIQLWAAEQDSTWWKSLPSEEKKQSWVVLLENEGQLVGLSELTGKPPEGVQVHSFSEGLWLRWVTYTQLGAQQLADELRESAIKSKLIPLGPALFRGPNAENRIGRRELLLSVKKQN